MQQTNCFNRFNAHEICKLTFAQSLENNGVKSIPHPRSRDQLQPNAKHNHSINLEFQTKTTKRNPCIHAALVNRSHMPCTRFSQTNSANKQRT